MGKQDLSLQFLGFGNATSTAFGNSCAVLRYPVQEAGERSHRLLAIDFGFTAFAAFKQRYQALPDAIFITHGHLDHIGGLENLFYEAYFSRRELGLPLIKLLVPYRLVALLHQRLASLDSILAEGGANFWEAFQLIPVGERFWLDHLRFDCFEVRHHAPGFAYGLCLPGCFFYSGDTKPIPELIAEHASRSEIIFHDVSLRDQPSHTFVDELSVYSQEQLQRMWLYHFHSESCRQALLERGFNLVDEQRLFYFVSATETAAVPVRLSEIS